MAGAHSQRTEWKEEQLRQEAQRCPCFNCPEQTGCRAECSAFKTYVKAGKKPITLVATNA